MKTIGQVIQDAIEDAMPSATPREVAEQILADLVEEGFTVSIPEKEFRLPDLRNATLPYLADELGDVRERMKTLKKYEGVYKTAIMSKLEQDQTEVKGERHSLNVVKVTQNRFSADLAKQFLTAPQIASCYKQIEFVQLKLAGDKDGDD